MLRNAVNNLVRPVVMRHMMTIVNVRPVEINIETTSVCPSRCVFCPNSKTTRARSTMDMGLFNKICEDYYAIGGGSVGVCSMQSDIFSDIYLKERLEILKQFKDRFILHTATMLAGASNLSDHELKTFLETFDCLDISIGGFSKEDYALMYGISAFDVVIDQLFRIEDIVHKNGIAINLALNFRTNNPKNSTGNQLLARLSRTFAIQEIRTDYFSWGGMITQADLPPGALLLKADNTAVRKDCVAPWATLCINADGTVVGCGCVDWAARHIIGDMRHQTIKEIWTGPQAQEFRTSFSRQTIPELCRDCSLYTNIERAFGRFGLLNYKPRDGDYHKANFPFKIPQKKRTCRTGAAT